MSNVIRNQQLSRTAEKRILHPRKIEFTQVELTKKTDSDAAPDPQLERKRLLQEIADLQGRAEQLMVQIEQEKEAARLEIDSWREDARLDAEQQARKLAEQATDEGFKAGVEQGTRRVEEEFGQKRQEINKLIDAAYVEKERIIQESEPFLLALSVKVAEKIIKNELNADEKQLLHIVRQALKHVEETEDVVLQVSAEDYPIVLPFSEELKTYIRADFSLKIIPVANLGQGDCIVNTASGSYDVTVDGQLEEIKGQLLAHGEEKNE